MLLTRYVDLVREHMTMQMKVDGNSLGVYPLSYDKDNTFCKGMLSKLRVLKLFAKGQLCLFYDTSFKTGVSADNLCTWYIRGRVTLNQPQLRGSSEEGIERLSWRYGSRFVLIGI